MVRTASLFGQILSLIDRVQFLRLAREHQANRYTKRFTAWEHFVSMAFAQMAQAKSLREVCDGLGSAVGKMVHLGVRNLPKKSTLAYANEHRSAAFFKELFFFLAGQLHHPDMGRKRAFRFRHKLLSLDASVITLCLSLFPWAEYTRTKGGVKLHLLLDHDGYWPTYAVLSDAKTPDVRIARDLALPKDSIVVIDRGYVDYALWGRWTRDDGVWFVSRLKSHARYRVNKTRRVPPTRTDTVVSDEEIQLTSPTARKHCPYPLRRVVVRDPMTGQTITLVTNHPDLAASTIGRIYRDRWEIELFFKALKQNLKVKTFLGTSENALAVQLWTALIAMLLIKYLRWRARRNWSLSNLVALLRWNLFQYKDLWAWLDDPLEAAVGIPDHPQLVLPGINLGQLSASPDGQSRQ